MKLKFIFLCILAIIFVLTPIFSINSIKLMENTSEISDGHQINFNLEGSGISSIPVIPIWSYNTASRNRNVAISSNGQYIAVACYDLNLYLFEKDNPTPIWTSNLGESVQSVAITPDGQYIVAGTCRPGSTIFFFEKNSSTPLWSYYTGGIVMSLAFSSNGQYIAAGVGRDDYAVYLFKKNSSSPLWKYDTGYATGHVEDVAITSDGNYIVAGAYNGNLYYFGKNSSTPIWIYKTPGWAYNVDISADGNYIVVGTSNANSNDKLYLLERNSNIPLWNFTTGDPIWSLVISSNGQYIVAGTGYTGNQLYLFERNSSIPFWSFDAGDGIQSVAISSNGKYFVAGSQDRKIYLFELNSSTPLWSYRTISNVECVAISSDGQYFVGGNGGGVNGQCLVYLFQLAVSPIIFINSPLLNQSYGLNAPEFSITAYSLYPINTSWYTLDGGATNHTFSDSIGVINQTVWDTSAEGNITIAFYANNSLGQLAFKDVQIIKDTIIPEILIHSPSHNAKFGSTAPAFSISITEDNLKSTWYSIGNFSYEFVFSGLTGLIDQNVWNYVPEGYVNITFYAEDEAGNIGSEVVSVIKELPEQPYGVIPGYKLFLIISLCGLISLIVAYKFKTKITNK